MEFDDLLPPSTSDYFLKNNGDLELLITPNVLEINDPTKQNENEKYQISNIAKVEKLEIETTNILSKAGIVIYGFLSVVLLLSGNWFICLPTSFLVYKAIIYKTEKIYILHFITNAATTFIIKSKKKSEIEEIYSKITESMNREKIKIETHEYRTFINKGQIIKGNVNQRGVFGVGIGNNFGKLKNFGSFWNN